MSAEVLDLDDFNNDILRSRKFLKKLKGAKRKTRMREHGAFMTQGIGLRSKNSLAPLSRRKAYIKEGQKRAKRTTDLTARRLRIERLEKLAKNRNLLRKPGLSNRRAERAFRKWNKEVYGEGIY